MVGSRDTCLTDAPFYSLVLVLWIHVCEFVLPCTSFLCTQAQGAVHTDEDDDLDLGDGDLEDGLSEDMDAGRDLFFGGGVMLPPSRLTQLSPTPAPIDPSRESRGKAAGKRPASAPAARTGRPPTPAPPPPAAVAMAGASAPVPPHALGQVVALAQVSAPGQVVAAVAAVAPLASVAAAAVSFPAPVYKFTQAVGWKVADYWKEYVEHVQPLDVAHPEGAWRKVRVYGPAGGALGKEYSSRMKVVNAVKAQVAAGMDVNAAIAQVQSSVYGSMSSWIKQLRANG